ncbi:MAG: thioesterase II family protein [Bryobacteraceae bacterium]
MSNANGQSIWLSVPRSPRLPALRLFCIPYAGGSATIFHGWQQFMPDGVVCCPVHLPGRGFRMREPLATDVRSIVESLSRSLIPYLDQPFALFGHSMGALICFELARSLARLHGAQPSQLFVSAWRSPELRDSRRDYELGDAELISVLRSLNGTPDEILANAEALELLLPILRADLQMVQTYQHCEKESAALTCPVRAYGGDRDNTITPDSIRPWKNHTTGPFSMSILPGDHMFLQAQPEFLRTLAEDLRHILFPIHHNGRRCLVAAGRTY